ncbi:hypothetical protein H6G89_27915 [Oscillatoria sp. FACHB-1407]|uniref:hypothetical protein n=1 Tax=Oscillatoria sp. FACHB-1407 TaxID=2692847 RepID=UPI0016876BAD|nr:hypothetical protein [Oscillatoria sp. FACHB-1407]MBD2464833.1 hypothetical protein [Oscillatoria sp. FACHB-1407]
MAKKSKGFNELLRLKQYEANSDAALEKLEKRVQANAASLNIAGMVKNPAGQEKMSDVLEAFVEPYLDDAETFEAQQKLFTIAIVAWNLALMPDDKRPAELKNFVQKLAGSNKQFAADTTAILEEFIERKQQFFANNKRYIIDFELQKMGKTHHLSVVSSMPDSSRPK